MIAKIYTEDFGLQSFIVNSVRSRKAKTKAAVLFPLTLIEAVVYLKDSRNVQKISDLKIQHPYLTVQSDIRKTSIILFLADILRRIIREEMENKNLFAFLRESLIAFDSQEEGTNLFHLHLLLHLTQHLGFFPSGEYSDITPYLDLREGQFCEFKPLGESLEGPEAELGGRLLKTDFEHSGALKSSSATRNNLLEKLLVYYRLHIHSLPKIKSHRILAEVLG